MKKMRWMSLSLTGILLASVFLPCLAVMPTVAAIQEPIRIGVFAPFTLSPLAHYAPWTQQGFELGLIYATTQMGYNNENKTEAGRPYEIHYYDTKGDATTVGALVTDAIEIDNIDILVGGTHSNLAAVIAPIAEEYEKLYFITPAVDYQLTASLFNPYVFRLSRNSYHDAIAGVTYAMDTLNYTKFGFLAVDYSFGYSGVDAMRQVIESKGGVVNSFQYAPITTTDFAPYITNLKTANALFGIDYLFTVWAGSFVDIVNDFWTYDIFSDMDVAGVVVDILSGTLTELSLTPPATIVGGRGLCVYGYELPNNTVNDWMVAEHAARNIMPGTPYWSYHVPELFTAAAFATAQFLVAATNAVPDLDSGLMINYLESGITIDTPKGPTYLRPEDHQGLVPMFIAEAWNDTRSGSETENLVIAKYLETLDGDTVAPPIASVWKGEPYVPGGFAPPTTTTTTPTTTTPTTTPPPPQPIDPMLLLALGGGVLVIVVLIVVFARRQ